MDPYLARAHPMTMNHAETVLIRKDPLRKLFQGAFFVLPSSARGHVVAVIGEFLCTIVFLVLAFSGVETASASLNNNQGAGVSTATKMHSPQQLLYIALDACFSLAVTAWTFFRISGVFSTPW
jgi:aquaporin related protein